MLIMGIVIGAGIATLVCDYLYQKWCQRRLLMHEQGRRK